MLGVYHPLRLPSYRAGCPSGSSASATSVKVSRLLPTRKGATHPVPLFLLLCKHWSGHRSIQIAGPEGLDLNLHAGDGGGESLDFFSGLVVHVDELQEQTFEAGESLSFGIAHTLGKIQRCSRARLALLLGSALFWRDFMRLAEDVAP